jgi:hypothetical protein
MRRGFLTSGGSVKEWQIYWQAIALIFTGFVKGDRIYQFIMHFRHHIEVR